MGTTEGQQRSSLFALSLAWCALLTVAPTLAQKRRTPPVFSLCFTLVLHAGAPSLVQVMYYSLSFRAGSISDSLVLNILLLSLLDIPGCMLLLSDRTASQPEA